jgi:hypothetical protein
VPTVSTLIKLLIPLALATVVLFSAATAAHHREHAKPEPQRSLQLNR